MSPRTCQDLSCSFGSCLYELHSETESKNLKMIGIKNRSDLWMDVVQMHSYILHKHLYFCIGHIKYIFGVRKMTNNWMKIRTKNCKEKKMYNHTIRQKLLFVGHMIQPTVVVPWVFCCHNDTERELEPLQA